MAHHPCATVSFEDDEWHVITDKSVHSTHETKKEAIATAKDVDGINTVMAFTKGNSNINTISC
ncbi:hypothetical protein OSG_eHP18_00195 [environmental Halophage eHP-18]|nr:hypothetical protein OSG_eHP17_00105 [environmental Halophage eHP-17]AFH22196.1 hypothetical protein OSG_eHP18_00195 [environmental Halophage eHP-18]AFH22724.1 hypothetical protein OSG_eHP33_00105 [environmental Halophage eHP-33]